ncbi:MAG TPA: hypothetical protein GX707_12025 [Epulopiscium sp.]|nr:hypothetical protein [Candidatus Epulonipiscium sp.]
MMSNKEKTTVTKYEYDGVYTMWYICDSCKDDFVMKGFTFCPICGKEIDWSVEE